MTRVPIRRRPFFGVQYRRLRHVMHDALSEHDMEDTTMKAKDDEEELELLDVEEYARAGKDKPRARRYRIRIDRAHYETANPTPTGREILALANKTPETHLLSQKLT